VLLDARTKLPGIPIVLATGRARLGHHLPVGSVIDRAIALLEHHSARATEDIVVDDLTASLVETRYLTAELDSPVGASILGGKRPPLSSERAVAGRVSPLLGRDRDLASLEDTAREAFDASAARAVLVTAEAGMGKTRLAQELAQRLREDDAAVWTVDAQVDGRGASLAPLARLVRRIAGVDVASTPTDKRASLVTMLSELEDVGDPRSLAGQLAALCGLTLDDAGPFGGPEVIGDELISGWFDLASAALARGPLALIVEDVQWLDDATLDVLGGLLREHDRSPLFLLALGRPEIEERALWPGQAVERRHLRPLAADAQRELVRTALGALDARAVETLLERANGNTFFLEELIRAAQRGESQVPESVLALVERRLSGLSDQARRLARCASLFGGKFERELLLKTFGDKDDGDLAARHLDELAANEILAQDRRADVWWLRHDLIRETLYRSIIDDERTNAHARLGRALADEDAEPADVARHLDLGDKLDEAGRWYVRAAERAHERHHMSAALEHSRRALELPLPDEETERAWIVRLRTASGAGDDRSTQALAEDGLDRFAPGSIGWLKSASALSVIRWREQRSEGARELLDEVVRVFEPTRFDSWQALDWAGRALERAEPEHVAQVRADVLARPRPQLPPAAELARLRVELGEPDGLLESVEHGLLELDAARAWGMRVAVSISEANAGAYLCGVGVLDDGVDLLLSARQLSLRFGIPAVDYTVQCNLAAAFIRLGRYDEARERLDAGQRGAEKMESGLFVAYSAVFRAQLDVIEGRLDDLSRDASTLRAATAGHPLINARLLGSLACATEDVAARLALSEEAWSCTRAKDNGGLFVGATYADALVRAGRAHDARPVLRAVLEEVGVQRRWLAKYELGIGGLESFDEVKQARALATQLDVVVD
jgi:hypothetical protein